MNLMGFWIPICARRQSIIVSRPEIVKVLTACHRLWNEVDRTLSSWKRVALIGFLSLSLTQLTFPTTFLLAISDHMLTDKCKNPYLSSSPNIRHPPSFSAAGQDDTYLLQDLSVRLPL